jgi:hypothetical protein
VLAQFAETPNDQQLLRRIGLIDLFVLKYPGVAVRNEDGIQTRSQRGIYVGLRAVADHPRGIYRETESCDYLRVGLWMFLCDNLDA